MSNPPILVRNQLMEVMRQEDAEMGAGHSAVRFLIPGFVNFLNAQAYRLRALLLPSKPTLAKGPWMRTGLWPLPM